MVFGGKGSVEHFARSKCPKAFEKWDGTEIKIEFTDNRGVKPSKKCTLHLVDIMGSTHATLTVNVDTDEVGTIFLAE